MLVWRINNELEEYVKENLKESIVLVESGCWKLRRVCREWNSFIEKDYLKIGVKDGSE